MNYRTIGKWAVLGGLVAGIALAGPRIYAAVEKDKKSEAELQNLSAAEALRQGAMQLWEAEKAREKIRKYLTAAQKKKDIIRINCVKEKLSRCNTVVSLARNSLKDLRRTKTKGDAQRARILYEKMSIYHEQAENIRREAEGCSGEELTYTGKTKVSVEVDDSVPKDDPSEPPGGIVGGGGTELDVVIIGRPPEVSPFF
jgi:hypothetical protein